MRAIWTGALSFGLVNIPVRLYSASFGTSLELDMLHKKDLSPIRYARMCKEEEKEVPYEDIVKGYEYAKGEYVILTDEDFKKANVEKTKTIDIQEFSKEAEIDTIYFEKPYYLEPDKGAEKAYALLREALRKSRKVGIAKFVLRNRERLAAIKPSGDVIVLEQMRFDQEIRSSKDLNLPDSKKAGKKELDMAMALIEQLTEKFNPKSYEDTYTDELKKVIDAKAKGKPVKAKGRVPKNTDVSDLMSMLKKSLAREQAKA